MRTPADLRAAYQHLADTAPVIDQLHLKSAATTPRSSRRRRTGIAVAAAAIVAAVAAMLVVLQGGTGHRGLQPATSPVVTCTATNGDPSAAQKDRPIVVSRLAVLGRSASVTSVAGGAGLRIAFTSGAPADAAALCTNAVLQVRPVVAAMHGPCATSATQSATVVCAPDDIQLTLGPTIFDDADVISAAALTPDPNSGSSQWALALKLGARGQRTWSAYTTAHNLGTHGQPTGDITTCSPQRVPCSDYAAFVIDGHVTAIPVTLAPITGEVTQLATGDQTPDARNLAARLNPLPVPMSPAGR